MEGFQGLSPSSSSSPNLMCQEDKSCLMEKSKSPQKIEELEFPCNDLQMEADYVKLMVEKETRVRFGSTDRPSWLKDARLDSVNWILNAQTLLGFRNQTAYLSITFLDLFLSIRVIEEDKLWAVRLLAIACLTLAGKMEEPIMPPLSGIPLTKEDNNLFDFAVIQRMELLVLTTFGWKMGLITPFVYINYLVSKLGDHSDKLDQLISKAFELVMAIVKEINLMDHRPSVIAAAAVLAAVDWRLTREALKLKISTVSLWETLENEEELYSCYSLMQRLATKDDLTSTPRLTEVDHTLSSPTTTTASTSTTSVVGAKRKLAFRDCDPKT